MFDNVSDKYIVKHAGRLFFSYTYIYISTTLHYHRHFFDLYHLEIEIKKFQYTNSRK